MGRGGLSLGGSVQVLDRNFPYIVGKQLVIEHRFEYNRWMELGEPTVERAERGRLDVALDTLDNALAELIETVETGGLEQLAPPVA